jgi:hypothetical protein
MEKRPTNIIEANSSKNSSDDSLSNMRGSTLEGEKKSHFNTNNKKKGYGQDSDASRHPYEEV